MTDLYIATPTQADYDALMRLAEAAGYEWFGGKKPTALNMYNEYIEKGGQVIHFCVEFNYLTHCDREYFENEGQVIETIQNITDIKSIQKVTSDNRIPFIAAKRLPDHYKYDNAAYVIQTCDGTTYTNEGNDFMVALAVEYKPKESEVMPEKVKLPKFMCTWLTQFDSKFPLSNIAKINEKRLKNSTGNEIYQWLNSNKDNQWKLIDAIRYGYEAEPEPRWGIKVGKFYVNNDYPRNDDQVELDSVIAFAKQYLNYQEAIETVSRLGFGEVVDFNKEEIDD
ncbi:DUF1642 domain-containing protein [Latilactobacillus sakei]|uniref:DUF1642 domain-containing protein n=1 Tax=Latilactobacillus sakei TaxID=1599 RepID=UPI000DC6440D|nr:DUF1642 domain-containing protein [Latilactobacillus sakei]SPS04273.1 hypothetical protein LAS9624_01113 [Latilactobacillus sakei]